MTKAYTTTEEQVEALGKIKFEPMQRDLFTGELVNKKIKRGRGNHIRLKNYEGERSHVPGMASWLGSGPVGKYCRDCHYFGTVRVIHSTTEKVDEETEVCALFVSRMGGFCQRKRNISTCSSCDKFEHTPGQRPRSWVIDADGRVNEKSS